MGIKVVCICMYNNRGTVGYENVFPKPWYSKYGNIRVSSKLSSLDRYPRSPPYPQTSIFSLKRKQHTCITQTCQTQFENNATILSCFNNALGKNY